jgi:ankyrin repeat protein
MKRLFTFICIILLTQESPGQVYTDIKQLLDAGIDINNYPPQDLLSLGIGNCDLELIKSAIAKGADINYREEINGQYPLCSAINYAGNAILPDEESIIASQIRDYGAAVFSGRSVSDLRRDYIEIIRFLLQKGAKATYYYLGFRF